MEMETLWELGEVKDKTEVGEALQVIVTIITDMSKVTGAQAKGLLVAVLMANKATGIPNIRVRIDRIGNGEIKMVKVGDTIIGTMIIRATWTWLGRL